MNVGFDGEPEIPSGLPFSAIATETPRYSSSSHCRLSIGASFPNNDGSGIEQASQPMDGRKSVVLNDACLSANINQLGNAGEPHYDFSGLESSNSPGPLDILGDVRSTIESLSAQLPSYASERSTSPMLISKKEACIQRLSDLSANLMKDLNRVISCKLACSFLFAPSDKSTTDYLFRTADGSLCQNLAIGRMFQGTETFLEILREYEENSRFTSPMGSLFEPSNFPQSVTDLPTIPQQRMETRWSVMESYLRRSEPPSTASESSDGSSVLESAGSDIPSMLTILNCYICLLKIFETVFLAFQYILQVPPQSPLYSRLPPVVPDFHINGFQLKNYRSLQLKMLIQVSRHMLDSIEKAMGFASEKGRMRGILGDPVFKILLPTLLKCNGLDTLEEDATGMKGLRDLLTSMEFALKE